MGKLSKLTAIAVQKLNITGRYSDGGGLYLQVSAFGTKAWLFRYTLNGRARQMGLGSLQVVSLQEARTKAQDCRKTLLSGKDPIEHRNAIHRALELENAKLVSFDCCSKAFIESMGDKWKNKKHRAQWGSTLSTYASPVIGGVSVQLVDTGMMLKVLEPIWKSKTETASRVRGRIEAVLDYATARGWREGENPARWRGHLEKLLAKPNEIKIVKHHKALPYREIPGFMSELRSKESITARALELQILTALRPGELVSGKWSEIDFEQRIWTVPAERMKKKREHRIPLSDRAIEILISLKLNATKEMMFPGIKANRPLATQGLLKLVKDMRPSMALTAHGFRSTFKDWAAEETDIQNEVSEMALAHHVKNKVEASYRRGDLFEKRRRLMALWCAFAASPPDGALILKLDQHSA